MRTYGMLVLEGHFAKVVLQRRYRIGARLEQVVSTGLLLHVQSLLRCDLILDSKIIYRRYEKRRIFFHLINPNFVIEFVCMIVNPVFVAYLHMYKAYLQVKAKFTKTCFRDSPQYS